MQSDNLAPAGPVPEWVHDISVPPPDPLRADGTDLEPVRGDVTSCPVCGLGMLGRGTIEHLGHEMHGWTPTDLGQDWLDAPGDSTGAWLGAVMLGAAFFLGFALGAIVRWAA